MKRLIDALRTVDDNRARLPAEAGHIAFRARAIRDSDILKSEQHDRLRRILFVLMLNAQDVAIDDDLKTDQ